MTVDILKEENNNVAIIFAIICAVLISVYQIFWKIGASQLDFNILSLLTNYYLIAGFAMYAFGSIFILLALKKGEYGVVYPVLATSFFIVTVLSYFILGEELTLGKIIGSIIIILAVIMISFSKTISKRFGLLEQKEVKKSRYGSLALFTLPIFSFEVMGLNMFSIIITIISAFCNAFGMYLIKVATNKSKKKDVNVLYRKELYLGAMVIVSGSLMYVFALKFEELSVLFPFTAIQNLFAGLIAYIMLHEEFNLVKIFGYAMIIFGILSGALF